MLSENNFNRVQTGNWKDEYKNGQLTRVI